MSATIDKLAARPQPLRRVILVGPVPDGSSAARPLWTLLAGAPAFDGKNVLDGALPPVALDQMHPLRVFAAAPARPATTGFPAWQRPELIGLHLIVGSKNGKYGEPNEQEDGILALGWGSSNNGGAANRGELMKTVTEPGDSIVNDAQFVQVVTEPLPAEDAGWPPETSDEIRVPPLRLVGGRVGLAVKLHELGTGPMNWLANLGIVEDRHWCTIWLVPDGIEFEADLPFPGQAKPLRARVLLHAVVEDQKPRYRLTFLGAPDEAVWRRAWQAITPATDGSGLAGLAFSARRSGALPAFVWLLPAQPGATRIDAAAGIRVGPDAFSVSLYGAVRKGSDDAAAELVLPWLQITPGKAPGSVAFHFEAGSADKQALTMTCDCKPASMTFASGANSDILFALDGHRLADELRAAYGLPTPPVVPLHRSSDADYGPAFGRPLIPAFVALRDGWLQFPVANLGPLDTSSDQVLANGNSAPDRASVLRGFFRFRPAADTTSVQSATHRVGSRQQAPWALTVERADSVSGDIQATVGQAGATLVAATIQVGAPRLSTRGLLWMSADRPDALEALPRLGAVVDAAMETVGPADAPGRDILTATVKGLQVELGDDSPRLAWSDLRLLFNRKARRWSDELLKPREARAALRAAGRCIAGDALFPAPDPAATGMSWRFAVAAASTSLARNRLGQLGQAFAGAAADHSVLARYPTLREKAKKARQAIVAAGAAAQAVGTALASAEDAVRDMDAQLEQAVPLATQPWPAVAWLRHDAIPLAAQMPMTRAAAGAVRPLESRDLLPFAMLRSGGVDEDNVLLAILQPAAGPLLALDRSRHAFQLAARWPVDPAPNEGDPPERGVALAAVGVPGVELRVTRAPAAAGATPAFQAAVRYDLPLLDEAFATASLPPLAGPAAAPQPAATPPRPPATALDWPLLADLWDEQERKLQLSRVSDSYLSGFRPLGKTAKVQVANLVRPLTWSVNVKVTAGLADLPYGTLELDDTGVSGNRALAGYSGRARFAAAGKTVDVEVLGFSPAAYPDPAGGPFDLDNRGAGAAPMRETSPELLARDVTYPGAAAASRLVTLAAPVDVTVAGRPFTFWFKDLLFAGDAAVLPAGSDRDFGLFDDAGRIVKAGREWRFAPAAPFAADIAFTLGHDAIPFFGFWLQPLRLLGATLDHDTLKQAQLECRLTLGPPGMTPGGGANVVTLTLARTAAAPAFEASFAPTPLAFTTIASLTWPGTATPRMRRVDIATTLAAGSGFSMTGGSMTFDIAGVPLVAGAPGIKADDATHTVTFEVTSTAAELAPGAGVLHVGRALLSAGHVVASVDGEPRLQDRVPTLELDCEVIIRCAVATQAPYLPLVRWPLAAQDGTGQLTLLGRSFSIALAPPEEGDGALALQASSRPGMAGEAARLSLALICRLAAPDGTTGSLALTAGRLDGSLVQAGPEASALFGPGITLHGGRCDFTCARTPRADDTGAWDGTATVHGVLEAVNAVHWPHLKTGPASVPLPGHDASARVGVTLDPAQPARPASLHEVEWQLAGHRLPLALACAIAAQQSTALWTIPVLSRHTLARQGVTRTWSGIETIALGRPRAIVREPAPAGRDVTTFAARYNNIRPGNKDAGDTPGMRWPGLGDVGTVLQGSLGTAFRQLYWKDKDARGDALMIAGGFLGVLRYRRGEPGRLVRVPVLAGIAGLGATGLSQTGFDGKTIELHWSDGPAARAVALTRPTAPAPANASYDALCAALIAGSLPMSPLRDGETLGDAVTAMLVEQSFDTRDPAAAADADTPFFLASAIEVDRLLRGGKDDVPLEAISLFAGTVTRQKNDGPALAMPLAAAVALRDIVLESRLAPGGARLVVLGDGLSDGDWNGPSPQDSESPLAPAIAAWSTALDAHPRAWMLKRPIAGDVAAYAVGILPSLALDGHDVPAAARRPFADDGLGPMAAPAADGILRWLAPPAEGPVAPVRDLVLEQDGAWAGSGLAGLTRSLRLPEQAGRVLGGTTQSPVDLVWLAQTQVPVYLPLKTAGLAGPAIAWLQAANPRQRLPVDTDVIDALAPPGENAVARQGFLPGPLRHCAIGERAGILTLRRSRLLTRLDAPLLRHVDAYDPDVPRFGGPAQAGSSFSRAQRTPRPGPIPPNLDPSVPLRGEPQPALPDRRIQASLARPLRPFAAFAGSADILQGRGGMLAPAQGDEAKALAAWSIAVVAAPDTRSVVSDRWDGSLAVACRLEITLADALAPAALAPPLSLLEAVLLPWDYADRTRVAASASLKIGARAIRMRWVEVRHADAAWTSDQADQAAPALRFMADVVLVLDPRMSEAYAPADTLPGIQEAFDDRNGLPAVELQLTVPAAVPAVAQQDPATSLALDKAYPLARGDNDKPPSLASGRDGPPVTLRMPLYPVLQSRGALTLTAVTLVFNDPAYNRDLAGPPASHIGPVAAQNVEPGRGALLFELAADRASAMLSGTVTFMLDLRYERRPGEVAQRIAETRSVAPGGDLDLSRAPPEAAVRLRIESPDGTSRMVAFDAGPLTPGVGIVYELPLARLVEANGTPALLRAGDMLVMEASVAQGTSAYLWSATDRASKPVTLTQQQGATRTLRIMLTADPVIEPPPALYAALLRTPVGEKQHRLELALHAQSPLPARVLLVEAARCFRAGMMNRHADFIWVLMRPPELFGANSLYVIKSDRNGQGYWPASPDEFIEPATL